MGKMIVLSSVPLRDLQLLYYRISNGNLIRIIRVAKVGRLGFRTDEKQIPKPISGEGVIGLAQVPSLNKPRGRIIASFLVRSSYELTQIYQKKSIFHDPQGGLEMSGNVVSKKIFLININVKGTQLRGEVLKLAEQWLTA